MAKSKFSYSELAVMNWIFGEKGKFRFLTKFTAGSRSSSEYDFHDIVDRDGDGKYIDNQVTRTPLASESESIRDASRDRIIALKRALGGSLNPQINNLIKSGFINQHSPLSDNGKRAEFAAKFVSLDLMQTTLYRATTTGRDWFDKEGRALYEVQHAKREAKRKTSERTIVLCAEFEIEPTLFDELKAMIPEGVKLPLPKRRIIRPIGTATVIGETEKRLTVEDITFFEDWQRYGINTNYKIARWPIQGYAPNTYVEPWGVMVDHANDTIAGKLRDIDVDDVESFDRTGNHHLKLMLPLLISMNLHLKQNEASREDIIREAIEQHSNSEQDRKPR
jgi:hypothetical protein